MRLLTHQIHHLFEHSAAAAESDDGAIRRPHHDIGARALALLGDVAQHAIAHTHQRQDERHLQPNGDRTQ